MALLKSPAAPYKGIFLNATTSSNQLSANFVCSYQPPACCSRFSVARLLSPSYPQAVHSYAP
ncbi:hypothetical protein KSP40_PGU017680 [Platanthera guangdongensis]|uniref:Uncharacterized protein n=1 Tax=Platanthera guangdongensis TaxID=2320717 RepID=A0ABR2MVC0_9ASPA